MAVWETALILFLLSMTILVILLIPSILQFRKSLKRMDETFKLLNRELPELLTNLNNIGDALSSMSKKMKLMTDDFADLEQMVVNEIKEPLQNIVSFIATILQFGNKLMHKRKIS